MFSSTKGKKMGKTSKKRKTCSSTNSETSREISSHIVHNRSLLNVAIGDEILSEAISKANDVLYVVHCDDSEIKSSTPRVEADIRGKLDELFRKHTLANRKLDGIVNKLNTLDSIDRKLTTLESSVSNLGQRVKKIEVKHEEFQKFVKFLSYKFDDETKKISAMDGEIRKHLKEIRDFKGKLANHQCNANNQTAQKNIDSLVKKTKRHETMIESMA